MNNSVKTLFAFAAGLGVGAFISWRILEPRYKKIAQEEIDSIKEVYTYKKPEETKMKEVKETFDKYVSTNEALLAKKGTEVASYRNVVSDLGYSNERKEDKDLAKDIYVISPDDFDTLVGYEVVSLTYYADDVLVDEFDDVIYELGETVGEDFSTHFGEYEDDSVFVRNDRLKIDYEILKDERNYYDVHPPRGSKQ